MENSISRVFKVYTFEFLSDKSILFSVKKKYGNISKLLYSKYSVQSMISFQNGGILSYIVKMSPSLRKDSRKEFLFFKNMLVNISFIGNLLLAIIKISNFGTLVM